MPALLARLGVLLSRYLVPVGSGLLGFLSGFGANEVKEDSGKALNALFIFVGLVAIVWAAITFIPKSVWKKKKRKSR